LGEELAALEPRRHEEVPGSLGGRFGHDRRLDVDESVPLHLLPDDRDQLGTGPDVPLQAIAPQVQPAVAVAQRLVDVLLVELEGERRGAGDELELVDLDFDLARREVRVHSLRSSRDDLSGGTKDELVANLVCPLRGLRAALGVDHELDDPGLVAEVDEDQPAVVPAARGPPGDPDRPADVIPAKLTRAEIAPAHLLSSFAIASASGVLPGPTTTTRRALSRLACVRCPFGERPA
jgi:hypothetical protein